MNRLPCRTEIKSGPGMMQDSVLGVMTAAPAATVCLLFLLVILAAGRWCGLRDIGAPSRVSCCCGQVVVEFPEAMPRYRVACCCRDCQQKVSWAAARGGPAVPSQVLAQDRPLDCLYFCNLFRVVRGIEHISFNRLREGTPTTNCIAGCCHTILFIDNPFYKNKCLLVQADVARVQTDMSQAKEPDVYIALDNWPANKAKALPALASGQTGDPAAFGADARKSALETFGESCYAPPPEWAQKDYPSTFKSLLADTGGKVETLGLIEGGPVT